MGLSESTKSAAVTVKVIAQLNTTSQYQKKLAMLLEQTRAFNKGIMSNYEVGSPQKKHNF